MNAYLWVKAFHVIAVISWMAGLLYLPRLMVYHCGAEAGSEQSETFKIMERRLLQFITTPAMLVSWAFGVATAWFAGYEYLFGSGWFLLKLILVVCLTGFHIVLANHVRCFAEDRNQKSEKYFRLLNEVPTVLMVAIVILVIIKPL